MIPRNSSTQSQFNSSEDPNARKNQDENLSTGQPLENDDDLLSSQDVEDETVMDDDEDVDNEEEE